MVMRTEVHTYTVEKELDVVVLRQALREVARGLALSLGQQARITAAISEVARNLLTHHWPMIFAITVHTVGARRALDVVCQRPPSQAHPSAVEFEAQMCLESALRLLDEASFIHAAGSLALTLRIWI